MGWGRLVIGWLRLGEVSLGTGRGRLGQVVELGCGGLAWLG